jgi:hypothetical protein
MKQITKILVDKKKVNTKALLKKDCKLESTALRSLESLLKILPNGTLSKKSLRELNRRLLIIDSWMVRDIRGLAFEIRSALTNAAVPYRKPKRI